MSYVWNIAGWVANSMDPDQMLHSVASDLGLFAQACLSVNIGKILYLSLGLNTVPFFRVKYYTFL